MKKNFLFAFIAALTYNTESAAVSPCENISGDWTSTKPTVFELSEPSTVNQISVQPITPKYSHIWSLEQNGCLIYGTNFWTSVQMDDDTGLPLVTGSQLVHGVMTPVGLAVISEKKYHSSTH
ncbi:hypothetical protein SARC_01292 [Sphaeroforma arctica JP610]|uniref:Uncharacterized protein n=1 Tax=Sphaeroforma arctica JP610 TaxID=667725 RepID=A0A0L0GCE8_9EUKA|nr:hypothetical protein SARC_01292 [Sphaeroforma arctica JP610]KNC86569.1 hypothetical protein SARC_01292 [Sphaeroforma arctica JP610]|eukprot:XP_014160471.1 hypothetical protein SARC_01292 [Sphaeroforma arctica JP610]